MSRAAFRGSPNEENPSGVLVPFSDERLLASCVYCGAATESKDHVPSRVLLDREHKSTLLPTVPACNRCNNGFSDDERYLACLIDCVVTGSTAPLSDDARRSKGRLRHGLFFAPNLKQLASRWTIESCSPSRMLGLRMCC